MPDDLKMQERHAETPDCIWLVVYSLLLLDCLWVVSLIVLPTVIREALELLQRSIVGLIVFGWSFSLVSQ